MSSSFHQFGINIYMDYQTQYYRLIETRQRFGRKFVTGCGFEKHHILPKSLGGTNERDNIVVLTPKEHFVAHRLLAKMFTGEARAKMCYALIALATLRNRHRTSLSSREYHQIRKAHYIATMDPDYRAMRSMIAAKQWTPERRAAVAEKTKLQWINDDKKHRFYQSAEWKQRQSTNTKRRWLDPEYQLARSEQAKQQWAEGGTLRTRNQ